MKGSLTKEQKIILRKSYFIPKEIKGYDGGFVSFNSGAFQAMIRSRRRWGESMKVAGWSEQDILRKIVRWHRMKKKDSTFAFLRIEYRNPNKLTQRQLEEQMKFRRQISAVFGRAYGHIRSPRTFLNPKQTGIPRPNR